jgi:hypothetical protein
VPSRCDPPGRVKISVPTATIGVKGGILDLRCTTMVLYFPLSRDPYSREGAMQAKGIQRGSRFQPPFLLTPGKLPSRSSCQDLDTPLTTKTLSNLLPCPTLVASGFVPDTPLQPT